ncbi:MAG: cell division protein SepF [Arachnia sp.]
MGLVEDGRYYEEEPSAELTDEVYVDADPEPSRVSKLPSRPRQVPEPEQADLSRIISVRPRSYNEARAIGENFRDGVPVIMNLSDMESGEDKRLVDFAAGLIFGLRGNIERVSSQVFLLCPENLVVGPQDKERLVSGGFFNQS